MYIRVAKEDIARLETRAIVVIGRTSNKSTARLLDRVKTERPDLHLIHRQPRTRAATSAQYVNELHLAMKEAVDCECSSLAIPVAPEAYTDVPDQAIPDVVVNALNTADDFLLKLLLSPKNGGQLSEIILVASDKGIAKLLIGKLSQKRNWSKARKLSFVLDSLKLEFNQAALCKRHFIHGGQFEKYLNTFSKECRSELEEKYEIFLLARFGEDGPNIVELMKTINRFKDLKRKVPLRNLTSYLNDRIKVLHPKDAYFVDSFLEAFEYFDPLFHYIKHLIPDEEFSNIKKKDLSFLSKSKRAEGERPPGHMSLKSGRSWKQPMRPEKTVRNQYAHLICRIRKVKELWGSVFPVHLLEGFWDEWIWKQMKPDKKKDPSVIAKEALCLLYKTKIDTIESDLYR